tara:strand:+ start:374 stop:1879 length:1506 start_codon:yes stop_codon:yes gene_type:complete
LDSWILPLILIVPVVTLLAILFIPKNNDPIIKNIAIFGSLISGLLSLYVFITYSQTRDLNQFDFSIVWLSNLSIRLDFGIDGVSALMVLLVGIVYLTGTLISCKITERIKEFFVLYILLIIGVYGVFISQDLFFFFFFYELAVVPMYLLIAVWGSNSDFKTFSRTKEYGALKLMLVLVASSILIWIGILSTYFVANQNSFLFTDLANANIGSEFQIIIFPFFLIGFGVLAGLWPFHTWSPDGHVAAPTSVSMVHAGILMKLGAYGILRSIEFLPAGAREWMWLLLILGTINVIYGALSAMAQKDLKYVIGYSSVSHMGYVLMGLATLNVIGTAGAVLQMFSHGIMTALFFALVGVIYERTHSRDIETLDGLIKPMGIAGTLFVIAGLTSLGLPGLSGFVAELFIFIGVFQTNPFMAILGVIGAAITAIYILRLIARIFFGTVSEKWAKLPDINILELIPAVILTFFIVLMGILPIYFIEPINETVKQLINTYISNFADVVG